jgi:glucose/mannose transport system substrate-binding protein
MIRKLFLFTSLLSLSAPGLSSELEVLHWWTSSGEAKSAEQLKAMVEEKGHSWKNFAIPGGGGKSAMLVLKARAVSGNPPSAAQIKGHDIQEWARLGFLADLDPVASEENWDSVLPAVVSDTMKYKGKYVAAPVNLHRSNWLWANPEVFLASGAEVPVTLEEFFAAADKIKAAGFIPLAYGGQAWQDATLFETVALAILGSESFRKAFVELDRAALNSDKMKEVFRQFKRMRNYIDSGSPGRTWNEATSMVIEGKAAMQIMGDWAKGEFSAAGKLPGKDYLCVAAPGTVGKFSYNIDSFVFFKSFIQEQTQGQQDLASALLSEPFQVAFNLAKGSLPARQDLPLDQFDSCARASKAALQQSAENGELLPSLSQGMSSTSYVQDAIYEVVSEFFHDENANPDDAPRRLARAVKAAQ